MATDCAVHDPQVQGDPWIADGCSDSDKVGIYM